uniref:Coat protein n=1 Tax=Geladintestivirus 4 TaxID=3233136 RepID=A0AAU8MH37_9CAUD
MTDIKVPLNMSPVNSDNASQTDATKQNPTVAEAEAAEKAALEAELDEEYIDKREIIIASVLNYSAYRRMNMAAIGKPRNMIGSSVNSVRKLMSNKGEVEHYFPELVGVASNNPEFITRVKNYLNNMFLDIRDTERTIDISFRYHHKRDYLKIKEAEDRIWKKYNEVDRSNSAKLYEAAVLRDNDLFNLESTKYQYGDPLNLEQYIIYRHCLNYPDVAKDEAFINSNANLRFYIKDVRKEEVRKEKLIKEQQSAMKHLVELQASPNKTTAVYINYCVYNGISLADGLAKNGLMQTKELMDFATNNPRKFNDIVTDRKLMSKAFVETLIARGELIRSDFNQQISTPDGDFIGANINDAIAFFDNPNNAGLKTKLENKLKLI